MARFDGSSENAEARHARDGTLHVWIGAIGGRFRQRRGAALQVRAELTIRNRIVDNSRNNETLT
jgi:hypothetical protein